MRRLVLLGVSVCILVVCVILVLYISNSTHTINLSERGFSPKELTIKKGAKVIWKNTSSMTGTVDSDPHPIHTTSPFLNLGRVAEGASVEYTFQTPGTYTYHNHYSPDHVGTIIVE